MNNGHYLITERKPDSALILVAYPCCLRIMNVRENRADTLTGDAWKSAFEILGRIMKEILLIEDDLHMCELLTDYMNCKGYHITAVHRLESLIDISSMSGYSLILIDLGLPDGSGITAIKSIRNISTSPIIVITGENSDSAKSICFTYGADDYVVKPFSITELESRIKANLRRVEIYDGKMPQRSIKINDLLINPDTREFHIDNQKIELTRTEFDILYLLASHQNQVFSKGQIYQHVWEEHYADNEDTVNTHINRLRKKLGQYKDYIETLWGIGYRMKNSDQ